MAGFKSIAVFLALSVLVVVCSGQSAQGGPRTSQGGPQTSQGGPHENQGRARRQVPDNNPEEVNVANIGQNPLNWTACDATVIPKISCYDCNTRVICKPIGGLLKTCDNPAKPHCNLGICSSVPSLACA